MSDIIEIGSAKASEGTIAEGEIFVEKLAGGGNIAIPVTKKFDSNLISLFKKFRPKCIVIHSTIPPGTVERMQKRIDTPLIYSATRGVHKRMLKDITRYTSS